MGKGRVLAVIPARSGSKGLPGKNIRPINGKPLVAWTIEQGLASPVVDAVVVSTDSPEIAGIAESYGARVPFLRPAELSDDSAGSIDVLLHTLGALAKASEVFDTIVMLEPTSPLREVSDITGAVELLARSPAARSVVGVAEVEAAHPRFLYLMKDGFLSPVAGSQPTGVRRQDLTDTYYHLEGSVYVSTVASLWQERSFYHDATLPWIVPRYKAIEIDELSDFICAEALLAARIEGRLT